MRFAVRGIVRSIRDVSRISCCSYSSHISNNFVTRLNHRVSFPSTKPVFQVKPQVLNFVRFGGHGPPLSRELIEERVMLVLRLFDKINADKVTLDSHFINDLGLDSLDQVEIIVSMEEEFELDIPDVDAERLWHPKDVVKYLCDKNEIYDSLDSDNAPTGT